MAIIQVRNVSDDAHRRFKQLAEREGISLSEYLRRELERMAERPTWDEIRERLRRFEPATRGPSSAQVIREERDARDRARRVGRS